MLHYGYIEHSRPAGAARGTSRPGRVSTRPTPEHDREGPRVPVWKRPSRVPRTNTRVAYAGTRPGSRPAPGRGDRHSGPGLETRAHLLITGTGCDPTEPPRQTATGFPRPPQRHHLRAPPPPTPHPRPEFDASHTSLLVRISFFSRSTNANRKHAGASHRALQDAPAASLARIPCRRVAAGRRPRIHADRRSSSPHESKKTITL